MLHDRYTKEGPIPLAEAMGRSEDSVSSFAHRCGLRTQRWFRKQQARRSVDEESSVFGR